VVSRHCRRHHIYRGKLAYQCYSRNNVAAMPHACTIRQWMFCTVCSRCAGKNTKELAKELIAKGTA
jgi:hypothetical protein